MYRIVKYSYNEYTHTYLIQKRKWWLFGWNTLQWCGTEMEAFDKLKTIRNPPVKYPIKKQIYPHGFNGL